VDQILYWNDQILGAQRPEYVDVGGMARALAMTHLAMYEAYRSIASAEDRSYLADPPVPEPDAAPETAMAVAAHTVLTTLYPQWITRLDTALRETGLSGPGRTGGAAHGLAVAHAVLAAGDRPG
jgi:vanadium chloroperoxidase